MSERPRILSLSGSIAVVHLSFLLLLIIYYRSFAGPDGSVHWNEGDRPILKILEFAIIAHGFPIGWLAPLYSTPYPTVFDIVVTAILLALNSAVVGYFLARNSRAAYSLFAQLRFGKPQAR